MTLHSALAEAVVLVRADGSHLQNDIGTHADKAGTVAGQRMGRSMASSFRRLVGSALVLEGAKSALEFADAFEKSRSRLETITGNIGADFEGLQGRVSELDDRLAKFGFTSADVEGSLASLETATKDPTKAMADLSLAADIARGRNMSLEASTRILMRVETGHVAMLSKLGIQTKDANGHLLTQKAALEALAHVYGGSASHYAGTFAGQQEALSAQIKNSAAEIGVALLPAAVELAKVVQEDVLPPIVSLAHFLDSNRKVIEPLAKVILIGAAAWKTYKLAARLAGEASLFAGRSAVTAAEQTAAAAATERAAGAGGLTGRGRFSRIGLGAGGAALLAGQFVPGQGGGVLSGAGTGAMFGSALGPEGAAVGALGGATASLLSDRSGNNEMIRRYLKQAQSNAAGLAAVKKLAEGPIGMSAGHAAGFIAAEKEAAAAALKIATATGTAADASDKHATAVDHAAAALNNESKQIRSTTAAMAAHASKVLAASGTYDSFRQQLNDLPGVVKENGRALTGYSNKAIANRAALGQLAQGIFAHVDALKAQHRGANAVRSSLLDMEKRLRAQATATYGSRTAVDAFLRKLGLLPGQVRRTLAVLGADGNKIGADLGRGLVAGMQAEEHAVTTEAKIIADQAVKGMRLNLQTRSPSKVTHKIGVDTAQGLVDGMKSKRDAVRQEAQQLADSVSGTIVGNAALTNTPNQSVGGVEAFLRHQLSVDRAFRRNLKSLAAKGYDKRLIGELAQAGPEAAGNLARQLAGASHAQVLRIDRLERGIYGAAAATGKQTKQEVYSPQMERMNKHLAELVRQVQALKAEVHGAQHKATARS